MILGADYTARLNTICERALADKPWRKRRNDADDVLWRGAFIDVGEREQRHLVTIDEIEYQKLDVIASYLPSERWPSVEDWLAEEPLLTVRFWPALLLDRYGNGEWDLKEFRNPSGEMGGSYLEDRKEHFRFDPDQVLSEYLDIMEDDELVWLDGRIRRIEMRRADRRLRERLGFS